MDRLPNVLWLLAAVYGKGSQALTRLAHEHDCLFIEVSIPTGMVSDIQHKLVI